MRTLAVIALALILGSLRCDGGGRGTDTPTPMPDAAPQDTFYPDLRADLTQDLSDAASDPDGAADIPPETDAPMPVTWDEPVPLMVVDGLPLFEGSVDGGPVTPFVFDTLAQIVFLDEDILGDVLYHEVDLLIGDDPLGVFQVKGRSMIPDEAFLGLDIAGLVGQSYIWKRFLVLDYPGGLFYQMPAPPDLVSTPLPGWVGPEPWVVDVQLQNAFPVVRPVLGDGDPVPLLADTSSPITTITQAVFDAIDDGTLPQVAGYVWSSKYGTEAAFLTRIPSLRFGDLEVTDLEAAVIPDDHHLVTILGPNGVDVLGWLGAAFWERFVLGIDPRDGTEESPQSFYLWGGGAAPDALADRWTRVGIDPAWRDGQVVVEMVFVGSDAEAQGIQVGYVLKSIDGVGVDGLRLDAVRALLRGVPGENRFLVLGSEGGGFIFDKTVMVEEILP